MPKVIYVNMFCFLWKVDE